MNKEEELETILRETEAPSRVGGRERPKLRIAKLTSRTISSLKTKISEKRLDRAYRKYNKNYTAMRRALVEANTLKTQHERGENVTNSEVVAAYDRVASYQNKLARYGVRLLEEDIQRAVAVQRPKPIRVPRILLGKLRPITMAVAAAIEKRKTKKLHKGLAKEMRAGTKDYIRDSLEGAVFSDTVAGKVNEPVDASVIQGLSIDRKADTFEDKIANLRRFVSADGKTSVFGEEEIGSKEKPVTDVAPVAPVASVEREDKSLTNEDLLSGLSDKRPAPQAEAQQIPAPVQQEPEPGLTVDDLTGGLKPPVEDKNVGKGQTEDELPVELSEEDKAIVARRKREANIIISLGNTIDSLRAQAERTSDPETKAMIERYIQDLNNELNGIIERSLVRDTSKKAPVSTEDSKMEAGELAANASIHKEEPANPTIEEGLVKPVQEVPSLVAKETSQPAVTESIEPVEVVPKEVTPETPAVQSGVIVTENQPARASQISTPVAVRVTSEDVAKLVTRYEAAVSRRADLEKEKEALVMQREELLRGIQQKTIEAEQAADVQARENAALRDEVQSLSDISSSIGGRSK
ncbi:MAG: hypothetical protein IJO43_02870 [Bacilli bacterium]|nr:hypothetical protein [Bacilli bacterium]